jgi:hypothetical protein
MMNMSLSDRFTMFVGKVVIGGVALYAANVVIGPIFRNVRVSMTFSTGRTSTDV